MWLKPRYRTSLDVSLILRFNSQPNSPIQARFCPAKGLSNSTTGLTAAHTKYTIIMTAGEEEKIAATEKGVEV